LFVQSAVWIYGELGLGKGNKMARAITKRYNGKTYKLYQSGVTYGYGDFGIEAKEIAKKLRAKGFSVRIENNVWGNTKVWIRK